MGVSAGYAMPGGLSDQSFKIVNNGVTAGVNQGFSLQNGPSVGVQAGYQWDGPRAEVEFLYQNYNRPDTIVNISATGLAASSSRTSGPSVDNYNLFFNGYYDFKTGSCVTPYVGAGIGVVWLSADGNNTPGVIVHSPGLNTTAFGYQAKAGVSFHVSDSTQLYVQYRYVGTAGFNYGGATATVGGTTFRVGRTSGSLQNSTVEVGVRFHI